MTDERTDMAKIGRAGRTSAAERDILEKQQEETIANRPNRRAEYMRELKQRGLEAPDPVVLAFRGAIVDGYSTLLDTFLPSGARITGARYKHHRAPSGFTFRNCLLYTDRTQPVSFIDAIVNGASILFEWNGSGGSLGKVEWSARALTEDEANTIEFWRDGA